EQVAELHSDEQPEQPGHRGDENQALRRTKPATAVRVGGRDRWRSSDCRRLSSRIAVCSENHNKQHADKDRAWNEGPGLDDPRQLVTPARKGRIGIREKKGED